MQTPTEAATTTNHMQGVNKDQMMLLALQGKGPTEIGKILKCAKSYVSAILKPFKAEIQAYIIHKENPQELWEFREYQVLNSVNASKLKEASPRDQFTMAGIARDKINIFTGKAPLSSDNLVFNVISNGDVSISLGVDMKEADMIDITPVDNT